MESSPQNWQDDPPDGDMSDVTIREVHHNQQSHERLCNERWATHRKWLEEFKNDIKGTLSRLLWVVLLSAGSLIILLAGFVFSLAVKGH